LKLNNAPDAIDDKYVMSTLTSKYWGYREGPDGANLTSIAQVEAFAQRCADLEAVCEAQAQFARKTGGGGAIAPVPPLGGLRGLEHARSLGVVEHTFNGHLQALRALEGSALDVKVFSWGEASARVRAE
jgi:hypothetical protein